MTKSLQYEFLTEQDIEALSSAALHDKLMAKSVSIEQLERIAARLPGADRLVN